MAVLNILIGLSGSGKSTFAASQLNNEKDIIVSSDNIRFCLYGDESIQGDPKEVFDEMFYRTRKYLELDFNVWYDATNLASKHRRALLNKLKYNCHLIPEVHYWFILATPEDCIARQEDRLRKVPEEVIYKQMKQFRLPSVKENPDHIHFVNKNIENYNWKELLKKAEGFDQKNHHHTLDLYGHLNQTYINLIENNINISYYERIGAGFHDIGKLYTQIFDDNGEAHYYNHQNVSAYLFLTYFMNKPAHWEQEIYNEAYIIQGHMEPYALKEEKIKQHYPQCYDAIIRLHKADEEAH